MQETENTDVNYCWSQLTNVLENKFIYSPGMHQTYNLEWSGNRAPYRYLDLSCDMYLLDDIQFALFTEELPEITLRLRGREDGPIVDTYYFTFDHDGLKKVRHVYNTD